MIGLGTIINTAAIIVGGLIGLGLKNTFPKRLQDTLVKANGISVMFIGIGGALQEMMTLADGKIASGGSMMIIVCMVLGSLVGSLIDLDKRIDQFGEWLKRKTKSENDTGFLDGFINTSLTVCIGAMAIIGAINDGLLGDYSLLLAKSVLDFIMVLVMTTTLGKGCIFSAIPVVILQGGFTLLARFIEPLMTPAATSNLSLIGSILIFCVGLNLVWDKKVKVANMLPAIIFAVAWAFLPL